MTKFTIKLKHSIHGEVETVVEIGATESFEDHYADFARQALKNAASRYVDYDSFGNDSAYLERLETVAEEFKLVSVSILRNAPIHRYAVSGEYSTDRGRWDDWVMASKEADARFAAKWQMANNEGSDPNDIDDFQTTMEDITINDCYPQPVTVDEGVEYLRTMANMVVPGDAEFSDESHQSDSEALYTMVRKARDMLAGKHIAA